MTDTPSSIASHPPQYRSLASVPAVASPTLNGSPSDTVMQDDNEDYTIKCICSYRDDDGSTVYCEKCETWQHIVCYYQGKKVPDVHFCAECEPRQLDARRAMEHQRRLRERVDSGDRKARRSLQKNHKKKRDSVTTAEQANGFHSHARRESVSAARDQPPPAKRVKTSHRASASITSTNGTTALPESRKRATSNVTAYPSPVKSPSILPLHPPIPMYSPEFLSLYENDKGKNKIDGGEGSNACSNSMSMAATNDLTTWYDSPSALQQATSRQHDEVFYQSEQPLLPHSWPQIQLKEKKNVAVSYHGQCPRWKFVVLEASVKKDDFIGEIKGDIGRLGDYCLDPGSRWNELRHPEPFVFFHPQIPIYIDSRAEGTLFRYVRRSCHPNVSLKTFVTGERDFHHCFVAKENIPAGTELTAMWYIDQTLFDNGKVKVENGDEEEPRRRATYFSRILSNFGDCACDSADCWLKNFDLRTPLEVSKRRVEVRRGRGKAKNAASPSSTEHAVNSRAGSENVQMTEEEDQADSRSTSDSMRSKPQSRDITPGYLTHVDAADELSQREKKKILVVERAFEEQLSKKQKPRRKNISGGGTIVNTSVSRNTAASASSLPATPNHGSRPPDLKTCSVNNTVSMPPRSAPPHRSSNMSPLTLLARNTPSPLSQSSRKIYEDRAIQTDPSSENIEEIDSAKPKAISCYESYEPPHIRRIRIYQDWELRDNAKKEQMRKRIEAGVCSPFACIVPSWLEERRAAENRRIERRMKEMRERDEVALVPLNLDDSHLASHSTSPNDDSKSETSTSAIQLPPPPLPPVAAHTPNRRRIPCGQNLQLSTMPPVPTFTPSISCPTQGSAAFSPTSTTPSIPPSPLSSYAASAHSYPGLSAGSIGPSPVKKKLSLGDYMSRRSNLTTTPVTEKPQAPATAGTDVEPASATMPNAAGPPQVHNSRPAAEPLLPTTATTTDQAIKVETDAITDIGSLEVINSKDEGKQCVSTAAGTRARRSPLLPISTTMTTATTTASAPSIPVELSSVLSSLEALAGGNASQRTSGGSS